MSRDHAEFAAWDAAYLLGALSLPDRRAFEEHLESCERCARAVAEIAPTLGLLARVDPARAASLLEREHVEPPLSPAMGGRAELLARAARERWRTRLRWTGGAAAAAAILAAVVVSVSALLAPAPREALAVELVAVVDAPLAASVDLFSVGWGTRMELECSYGGERVDDAYGVPYALVVEDVDGNTSEVSSWRAEPGATARLTAASALDLDRIAAIEIRLEESGEVLMRAELADG